MHTLNPTLHHSLSTMRHSPSGAINPNHPILICATFSTTPAFGGPRFWGPPLLGTPASGDPRFWEPPAFGDPRFWRPPLLGAPASEAPSTTANTNHPILFCATFQTTPASGDPRFWGPPLHASRFTLYASQHVGCNRLLFTVGTICSTVRASSVTTMRSINNRRTS